MASLLKDRIMMIDEFLAGEIKTGNLSADFESNVDDRSILIHGHCHQKALYGTDAMKSICRRAGQQVEEISSGCCGMAGSFGYEQEHYDISEKIGEMVLFPAVRAMNEGSVLVANGFSCRHQIEHFTGKRPKHWVEVIKTTIKK